MSSLKPQWAEILVARRVEQVEGEALMLKAHHAEETEMPRSTAIQSERTRRRSPLAFTSPASWHACCPYMLQ